MAKDEETRKLAAVLFADIEGYTAMFQQNETLGLEQIRIHREYLEEIVVRHHGTLVHYFGDGSLIVFDSVIDAIHCSIQLQLESRRREIPLRIGIHIGDLVMRDHDVFGDAVNVASRIQAVGIAGSVITSKKVADELLNHPEIKVKELGLYTLKNVKVPLDLFALVAPGLVVPEVHHAPRKRWRPIAKISLFAVPVILISLILLKDNLLPFTQHAFKTERILIPPFKNLTSVASLDPYAYLAGEWITTELIQTADANVINYESALYYTNTDLASLSENPTLARRIGADLIVSGSYSIAGVNQDSLVFLASIVDTRTRNIIPVNIPKCYCSASDPSVCLRGLSNSIKGYWRSKGDQLFSHPTNEAYQLYIQARNKWTGPDKDEAIGYLRRSIKADTTYFNAYFLLLDAFYNEDAYKNAADTLQLMRARFSNLTPRQENFMQYHEEDLKGRRTNAFHHFMEEYRQDPKDLFMNTSGMVMAIEYLNDPSMALEINKEIDADSLDLNTCSYCRTRILMAMIAYAAVSDIRNARKMADRLKLQVARQSEYSRLIEFYVSIGDTSSVKSIFTQISRDPTRKGMIPFLYFAAARQALLSGNLPLRDRYVARAISAYGNNPGRMLARCYYLNEDLDSAEKIYLLLVEKQEAGIRAYGELGIIYARKGLVQKAREILDRLDQTEQPFDFGEVKYLQARIHAQLGETNSAIELLNRALDDGYKFISGVSFQSDPDLIVLHSSPEYIKLLGRNRQK